MILKDKNIVLTGGSSGIGYETLKILLNKGANVLAVSRTMESVDINHKNLIKRNIDVSKREDVKKLFIIAQDLFDSINIFIANAGFGYYEEFINKEYSHIEKIFRTNALSIFYMAERMKEINKEKSYNFVITASAVSFISLPGYALYSGTKAAVRGFADAYRFELNDNQHLQLIYPVATKTNFFKVAGADKMPWPRQTPKRVAKVLVKGIETNKKNIYPSKLFLLGKIFVPFAFEIYQKLENKKFQNSFNRQDDSNE